MPAGSERGCPWDLKQDFDSIAPYTLEETYELVDAIASGDYQQIKDELGDVLFQVVFILRSAVRGSYLTLMMLWPRFHKSWCGGTLMYLTTHMGTRYQNGK